MIVYMATNRSNGKEYVGQTVNSLKQRKKEHITDSLGNRCNTYFHRSLRKYGKDSFDWEILHNNITNIDDLNKLEAYYIELYDTLNNGYNLMSGGENAIHSDESKKKMSVAQSGKNNGMYGRKHTDEALYKMKNKIVSEETKKRIAEGGRNRLPISEETRKRMSVSQSGENNGMYGKHHLSGAKKKISKARKGKYTGKNNPTARAVVINNTCFDTLTKAAGTIGIAVSTVRKRILHKTKWLGYKYVV